MLNYHPAVDYDLVFHALADPTRREMVDRLSRSPATVSELAGPLAISLPGVLQHLRVLEGSGLVRTEKRGRVRTCHLDTGVLRGIEDWVAERRARWMTDLDRLEAYLASESGTSTESASPSPSPTAEAEP